MSRTFRPLLLLCIGLAAVSPLYAAAPGPSDPSAPAPATTYESAFQNYRSDRAEPSKDWRAVNDEVGRIGGHVGIFRSGGANASHGATGSAAPAEAHGHAPVRSAPQAPAAAAGHQH